MNKEAECIEVARKELLSPTFDVTKQHLAVMAVKITNGSLKVARVNISDQRMCVYFHIENERFFIVVYLMEIENKIQVRWVDTESGNRVYLTATSESLSYQELTDNLTLEPLSGWSKGDLTRSGVRHRFSRIYFDPIPNEAYALEDKLEALLTRLDQHREEVIQLSKKSNVYIAIYKQQYIDGNNGISLDIGVINKLHALNLSLDIDTCIGGDMFTYEDADD